MLEFMLSGGNAKSSAYLRLTQLTYTGSAPIWNGYTYNLAFQPNKGRIILSGYDTYKYPFDLETNKFGVKGSMPRTLSYGSRFSEADSLNGYLLRWGQSNGSYIASSYYYDKDDIGRSFPVYSNAVGYLNQCTIGDKFYLFGGLYGKTVNATNDMSVYTCSYSNSNLVSDGAATTGMPELTYNACVGHTNDAIYMFGGAISKSTTNSISLDVWCYTLSTKRWSKISTVPYPITGGGNTPFYDGKFWFLGTSSSNTEPGSQQLWSYRIADGLWTMEANYDDLATCRNGGLFIYKDKLYYVMPMRNGYATTDIFTINLK